MQSENLFSNFAEARMIFERSSKTAEIFLSRMISTAKVDIKKRCMKLRHAPLRKILTL